MVFSPSCTISEGHFEGQIIVLGMSHTDTYKTPHTHTHTHKHTQTHAQTHTHIYIYLNCVDTDLNPSYEGKQGF